MKKLLLALAAVIGLICVGCQSKPSKPAAITGYKITYEFELISNNSVGDDWMRSIDANGSPLANGDILPVDAESPLYLSIIITENDKRPDVGRDSIRLPLEDGAVASTRITVREDRGRFSGNSAVWEVTCFCEAVYE